MFFIGILLFGYLMSVVNWKSLVFMQTQSLWTAKQQDVADSKSHNGLSSENVRNSTVDPFTPAEDPKGWDNLY